MYDGHLTWVSGDEITKGWEYKAANITEPDLAIHGGIWRNIIYKWWFSNKPRLITGGYVM